MAKRGKKKAKNPKIKKPIVNRLPTIVPVFNDAKCGSGTIIDHEERIFELEKLVVCLKELVMPFDDTIGVLKGLGSQDDPESEGKRQNEISSHNPSDG